MVGCKATSRPIEVDLKLLTSLYSKLTNASLYKQLMWSLIYLTTIKWDFSKSHFKIYYNYQG